VKLMPIRYVHDMDAARRFYEALGLSFDVATRPPRTGPSRWVELTAEVAALALHYVPPGAAEPEVELSFAATEPLEQVVARLRVAGFEPATAIVDESFGRSFTVRDPDGVVIQVNEPDPEFHP
jgi:catechol 2,3-dioxygenase-like lactoylglutathione lyase family enzyme